MCVIKQFKELGVEENKLQIFFSGNKGFHLIIPAELFGIKPSKNLNKIYRKMAKSFCEKIQNKTLDLGIYDRRRLLRIPNSINSKANLYKIPLVLRTTEVNRRNKKACK